MTSEELMLARLFKDARSHNGWLPDPVSHDQLVEAYELAKWGPTSMNTQPMRLVFLWSVEAKERLKPAVGPRNVDKVMTAPVVSIIAYDSRFFTELPKTFPHNPAAQAMFEDNVELAQTTAFRNGTLQAAYWMLALRAVGLDVGPMSGFDTAKVDAEFFKDSSWRSNFLCGIGHGDHGKVFERLRRHTFSEATIAL